MEAGFGGHGGESFRRSFLHVMEFRYIHVVFRTEGEDEILGIAGIAAGETAACGKFPRNRDDARGDTCGAAEFFEAKGHVCRFERGNAGHEISSSVVWTGFFGAIGLRTGKWTRESRRSRLFRRNLC